MKISEQIPFTPMALVTDFLQQPSERPGVVEVDGKPSVTMQPNTGYWVSGMAMERAGRIMREKDAEFLRVLSERKRDPIGHLAREIKRVVPDPNGN